VQGLKLMFDKDLFYFVKPTSWQAIIRRDAMVVFLHNKETYIYFASQIYGESTLIPTRHKKPHDGIADALCIFYAISKKPAIAEIIFLP
jgi:hypothetical protein